MKSSKINHTQLLILFLIIGMGCKKEVDFRDKYIGNFNFTTEEHYVNPTDSSKFDTTIIYLGTVSKVASSSDQIQIYYLPDGSSLTVTLSSDGKITDNTLWPNETKLYGRFESESQLNISS